MQAGMAEISDGTYSDVCVCVCVSQCISGIVGAGRGDTEFFRELMDYVSPRLVSYSPLSVSRVALAFAKCDPSSSLDLKPIFSTISQQVQNQINVYSSSNLSMVSAAFALADIRDDTLFEKVSTSTSTSPSPSPSLSPSPSPSPSPSRRLLTAWSIYRLNVLVSNFLM